MTIGIGNLYPVAVLEHSRHPRNRRTISGRTHAPAAKTLRAAMRFACSWCWMRVESSRT